jgi:hypothetical protein
LPDGDGNKVRLEAPNTKRRPTADPSPLKDRWRGTVMMRSDIVVADSEPDPALLVSG